MIITYEELTEDTVTTLNAVYSFLALDPNLNAGVTSRLWHVHEQVSPIQNMNERSLSVLTEREIALIESIAGPLLHKLNYSARRGVYK